MTVIYTFKNQKDFDEHDFMKALLPYACKPDLETLEDYNSDDFEIYLRYTNNRYEIIVSETFDPNSDIDDAEIIGGRPSLINANSNDISNEPSIEAMVDQIKIILDRDLMITTRKNNIEIFLEMQNKVLEKLQNHKELLDFAKQSYTIFDGIQKITNLERSISRRIHYLEQQWDNEKKLEPDDIIADLCNTKQYFDDNDDDNYYLEVVPGYNVPNIEYLWDYR